MSVTDVTPLIVSSNKIQLSKHSTVYTNTFSIFLGKSLTLCENIILISTENLLSFIVFPLNFTVILLDYKSFVFYLVYCVDVKRCGNYACLLVVNYTCLLSLSTIILDFLLLV